MYYIQRYSGIWRVTLNDDGTVGQTTGQLGHCRTVIMAMGGHPILCHVVLTTEWATMG